MTKRRSARVAAMGMLGALVVALAGPDAGGAPAPTASGLRRLETVWIGYAMKGEVRRTPRFDVFVSGVPFFDVFLRVGAKRGGTVAGQLSLGGPDTIPVQGVMTRGGEVLLTGSDGGLSDLVLLYGGRPLLPGSLDGASAVGMIEGNLHRLNLALEGGPLGLLRRVGGPTELAEGDWVGRTAGADATEIGAMFETAEGGGGRGAFRLGDSFFDVLFDIQEVEGSSTHGFGLVGAGADGIIIIGGTFTYGGGEPHVEGTYRLVPYRFPVRVGTFSMDADV